MRRRTLTTLALLAALALTLGWLPNSTWLRGLLGSLLVDSVAAANATLTYGAISGYAWRGLTLTEPRLEAVGLDVSAASVAVSWFLPALVVGELPLRLDVAGLAGDVEVGRLTMPATGSGPAAIRVRIDGARLDVADLRIAEIPFDLPDLRVERLEATSLDDGRWELATVLVTAEGRVEGTVRGRLGDDAFAVTLEHGDARVARHWWDGIEAGTVRGELAVAPGLTSGLFEVVGGAVDALGTPATDIAGPIAWQGDVLEVAWTGAIVGGRFDAGGTVDLARARWQAEASAEAPLAGASRALLALLGAPGLPGAEDGVVRARVAAEGWTAATVAADIAVEGDWLGAALAVDDLRLAYDTARGLSLSVDGRWGDGDLRLHTEARDGPSDWSAEAGPLRVLGVPVEAFAAEWTTGDGPVRGRATARGAEGPWALEADVVLDAEGLQAFVGGSVWGGAVTGALATAVSADARVEGGVTWLVPAELATGTASVELRVGGDLGAPTFDLELAGDAAVLPRIGALELSALLPDVDLRGGATGTLGGGRLQASGRLGPVAVEIDGDVWTVGVSELRLGGPLRGTLGPAAASGGPRNWTVDARTSVASGPALPGTAEPLWVLADDVAWRIEGGPDGWTASGNDDRWRLTTTGGGAWQVDAAPITWLGRPGTLDAGGTFTSFAATGTLPQMVATAAWADESLRASIHSGGERLDGTWGPGGRIDVAGALDLGVVLRGWADLTGVARVAGAWETSRDGLPRGEGAIALSAPWPATVALSVDGTAAHWNAESELADLPLRSSGSWRPGDPQPLAGTLTWDELAQLRIDGDGVSGSGTSPGWSAAGVRVEPQAWRLQLTGAGAGEAEFGATRATFELAEPRLDAAIDLGLWWGGQPARVTGRLAWSAERPDGELSATLALATGARATVAGDLRNLSGTLEGPVADWAAAASPLLGAEGEAALAGELTGTLEWRPEAPLEVRAGWRDGEDRPVTLAWTAAGGELTGADWRASLSTDGGLEIVADGARLEPLLRRDDLELAIDGTLTLAGGSDSSVPAATDDAIDVIASFAGADISARLVGGDEPGLGATVSYGVIRVSAEGPVTLAPAAAWRGTWRLADEDAFGLEGSGAFVASAAESRLGGAIELPAGARGPLAWPRLAAEVDLRPDGVGLAGAEGLAGSWPAGLSAVVTVADVPTSLRLRPDGRGWALDVDGELVTAAWSGDLDAWALRGTARVAGLALALEADGAATTASGRWFLAHDVAPDGAAAEAEPWAEGRLTLDGGALEVVARGEDIDLARASRIAQLPDPATHGELRARVAADGWSLDGQLDAAWPPEAGWPATARLVAAGRALSLTAEAELAGVATSWSVSGADLQHWPATSWALAGRVDEVPWTGEARTDAAGVDVDLASSDGRWRLTAGGGREGRASASGPGGFDADVSWRLEPSLEVELDAAVAGFAALAHVGLPADGSGDGPWLRLDVVHAHEPWRAHLIGPLDPLALSGAIALSDDGFAARLVSSPTWRLSWGGLELAWDDGGLTIDGRSEPGQLPAVELEAAGLRWHPGVGWAGRGRLAGAWDAGTLGHLDAVAELVGAVDLEAQLALSLDGAAIGGASLSVGPDPTTGVAGDADLAVPLAPLARSTLFASGPVSYGSSGVGADLELRLVGPWEAAGWLTADTGALTARLTGPGIELTSELRGAFGEGRLELRELALEEALPFLREPRLSADAEVAWNDAGWSWRVDSLRLTTPGGLLEAGGVGGPNGRVEASARVDVDLRDLLLDSAFSGRVRGPVSFDGELGEPLAGTIAASLEAEDVRWSGLAATWRAALSVTGSAGDPLVRADWAASGPDALLEGDAAWWPARSTAELRAGGNLLGARLALDLGLAEARFTGGGEVDLGGETWAVATDAGRLGVSGSGRWLGWSVEVDPADWRADVIGDLVALPASGGTLVGTIGLGPSRRPVVDLVWSGATVAGVDLGDGSVTGDAEAGWALTGTRATGSLHPGLQSWELTLDAVEIPVGDTTVSLVARGSPGGVELAAVWAGDTPAGPLDLRFDAIGEGDLWRGDLTGHALGGVVAWPLALEGDALGGSGRLTGASVAGAPLEATLGLAGTLAEPVLAIGVAAADGGAWRVDVDWRAGVARVDASLPPVAGAPLVVRGEAWPEIDVAIDGGDAGLVRLTGGWRSGALRLDGELGLDVGDLRLEVAEPTTLRVLLPALGGGLTTTLPDAPVLDAIAEVTAAGWWWRGTGLWTGSLRALGPDGALLVADELSIDWGGLVATLDGRVEGGDAGDAVDATLDLRLDLGSLAEDLAFAGAWAWSRPAVGTLRWSGGLLSLIGEAPWGVDATVDPASGTFAITLDVVGEARGDRPPPSAAGHLTLAADGWGGELRIATVTDALGEDPATFDVAIVGAGGHLTLDATVLGTRGSATAVGRWDAAALLPAGWGPATAPLRELDARVVGLDLTGIAGIQGISGDLGGSATLRGDRLFGRLSSGALTYGGRTDPARLEFQADLAGATGIVGSGRLDLEGASAQFDVGTAGVSALVRLERFPLHAWVEAVVGPSDVRAEVTGAVRGAWAWGDPAPDDLRVAAERIELERAGVVTIGELSVDWDGDSLTIGRAAFEGRGTWQARGRITPELLDLELLAQAADFGPLLGLVPSLARYGVSAEGNLVITAHGTPASPDVALRTDDLRLLVAGTRYQLLETRFTLRDENWSGRSEIVAIAPVTGRLDLATDGRIGAFPEGGFGLRARAVGDLDVPFVGRVEEITAELAWSDDVAPTLSARGTLGAPFTIDGSLAPLDLRATGRDLLVTLPFLAIADALLDVDLRLVDDTDGVRLGGRVDASQARIDLATRAAFTTAAAVAATVDDGAPPALEAAPRPVGDPRERFRFDGVRIVAPQRVTFNESFGNAEASVDLSLSGTAALPRLAGQVAALRGTVRFAGRDLELIEAVATFDPTRGVYPAVRVAGRTAFEKARVVASGESVRFLAPAGPRFEVVLVLEGVAIDGASGFTLDLTPVLTSDVVVEGLDGGGARALTELELLTLLTLGRLEAGGGVAGAVAQSALDTAVDVLITGEIQTALSEALGGAVVELRTTALSSLLDGQDPFGVSLRLGGYLSDEVFASYRVSTLGGDAFSNEVALSYQLGRVAMDVTGRFDVAAGAAATRGPSLAIGGRYGLAPGWALELGLDLSTERSTARLGVTWRW